MFLKSGFEMSNSPVDSSNAKSLPGYRKSKQTIAEFILETENHLRRETHHKTENSSNVNPVCDEFPVSIYPSNFPGQNYEKVGPETRQRRKFDVLNSY